MNVKLLYDIRIESFLKITIITFSLIASYIQRLYIRCVVLNFLYRSYEVPFLCVLYVTNDFGKLPSPCFAVTSTRAAQKMFFSTTDREIGMIPNKLKIHIVKTDTHFFAYLYIEYSYY